MAEPPPESSRTPPGTPLNDPIQPHEHLMEDPNLQGTRKRPRLDSGSRESETLSIDRAALTPAAPASETDVAPESDRPSNKMTINVKSPESDMAAEPAQLPPAHPGTVSRNQSPEPDATSAHAISLSSSPAQSPEIEVADLEDMDQDPNTSNWRPLEEALRDEAPHEVLKVEEMTSLVDSFPRVREKLSARDNVQIICMMVEKGDQNDAAALTAVKLWMDDCVRNLGQLTPQLYTEDNDFWEYLPMVVETLLRRGQELPMDDGSGPWECLEEFLMDYAQIALHLIRLDTLILSLVVGEADTQTPDCMSHRYLQTLGWILSSYDMIPFYRALNETYDAKPRELLLRVREKVTAPALDLGKALAELAVLLLELAPRCPSLSTVLALVIVVANSIIECQSEQQQSADGDAPLGSPLNSPTLKLLYDVIRSIDAKYQEWITKKSSWVSSELSDQLLRLILRSWTLFCKRDPAFADQMCKDAAIELSERSGSEDKYLIFTWGWKFGVLKKHIMEGRMELRVQGVETMQSDLVSIWKAKISNDPAGVSLPFVQYLVHFIKDNKIVDYLVGVDSHPQLISRSSNIVGFLIVTSTYTDVETDTIWRTVTESQDSRIVSEVLAMFVRTFYMHATASPALLYACTKVLDLPLDRFDSRMFDFCDSLLSRMSTTDQGWQYQSGADKVDAIPLRLCVRLVRESTAADHLSVEQRKQLQNFGSRHLTGFIKVGISEENRMEIYEQCIQDVAEMNKFTAGSIQAFSALVPVHDRQEMRKLASDFDLTRLVINNLLHIVSEADTDFSDASMQHILVPCVSMLFRLIDMAPETITPELGQALWNEVFLSKKLATDGYKAVWDMMVGALGRGFEHNVFLDRCIHEYLPELKPKDYSHEILAFAKQSVNYEVRFNPPSSAGEDEAVSIPGMDRIWTFILAAPPGTIETEATKFAIEVYLDHPIMRSSPRSAVDATHVAIADRCIDQLRSAAKSLQLPEHAVSPHTGGMETDGANGDVGTDELRFSRSLLFLHRLLHGLRARPQYNSPKGSPPSLPERPLRGSPLDLTWQSFNGNKSTGVNHLKIGDVSTVAELIERLTQLTGFSKFTTICGGQKIDLFDNSEALLKDMKVLHSGLLIIRKAPDAQEVSRENGRHSLTSVDVNVLNHFDEIYDFLALKEDIASEVYDLLVTFPPPDKMLELVKSEESDGPALFPFDRPLVAFYSFHVLLICLREEAAKDSPQQSFVNHSIEVLVAFLMADELAGPIAADDIKFVLATTAVECLLSALAAYRSTSEDAELLRNPTPLITRLLSLIGMARSAPMGSSNDTSRKLICYSFAVLVEGSLRDSNFWDATKQQAQLEQLILGLLLEESRQPVRNEVAECIKMICSPPKQPKQPEKAVNEETQTEAPAGTSARIDMLATVWDAFVQTIPQAPKYANQSAEFFGVALWVFRSVAEKSPRDVMFSVYLRQWSNVMFSHRTEEFVGRETVDDLILGFARLLELCLDLADNANVELDTFDLTEQVLNTYLFPDLSPETDEVIVPQVPVMHTETRQKLYSVVTLLCKRSDSNLYRVMELLEDMVPRDYSSSWLNDRSKMIRAPQGYAGLRNLSNTCYLNSLMTQLFMNIEFREFMLKLKLVSPESSQKLLSETQRLFAWMQETWLKSVDPQGFVESIRTYDNDMIDVSIQMDVDEFYNLLFDRWEAQVLDPEEKQKFRSFFGGQLVQQIKSKECTHISERLEPFSAIQCDIKGKASLEESLQAYVEGEIMQGDNKYSCTACGRHVDAVKRACLKDVPDNLIFHLKRFDFDMVTMLRSKINDEFQFPERIDMTPYNVEYLSTPDANVEPDIFELVGVLVHTGTAESGHYYSYTRERPTAGAEPSWVEFNDSDVSSFNASTIAEQCFGGPSNTIQGIGGAPVNKVWNAYMLFYQRVSKMDASKEVYKPLKKDYPARAVVPQHLANHIAMENELFIRSYCLLDPCYAWFAHRLLLRWRSTSPDFPQKFRLESLTVNVGLDTLEQLVTRTKDYAGLDALSTDINGMVSDNARAAVHGLQWFCQRETSMRNLIFRISNSDARQKIIVIILRSIKEAQSLVKEANDDVQRGMVQSCLTDLVEDLVDKLEALWPALQSVPRVWEDYFEFLLRLAETGPEMTGILLEHNFFLKCMEIIWVDQEDRKRLKGYYMTFSRMLEKGRRFNYYSMMALCASFFASVDLSLPSVPGTEARILSPNGKYPLRVTESKFIEPIDDDGSLSILMKILQQTHLGNRHAVRKILAAFLASEPDAGFLHHIIKTLQTGLRFSPAEICIPFLEATAAFCKFYHDEGDIVDMITHVAKGVDTINNRASMEHLEFFTHLCTMANERAGLTSGWFTATVRNRISDFAPALLIDTSRMVRQGTLDLLNLLLFTHEGEEMSEELQSRFASIGRELVSACVGKINRTFRSGVVRAESRRVHGIVSTVNHCLSTYLDESADDQKVAEQANDALSDLQQVQIDVPEDLVSESDLPSPEDWEATSALASDSEMGLAGSP